jgi:hypothetical protein
MNHRTAPMSTTTPHHWRFFRSGGLDQARLETTEDLRALRQLDPKLWVALACPVAGQECDEKTLRLIDSDQDGRVRLPEIIAAVEWTCRVLKNPAGIFAGMDGLPLAAINTADPDGAKVLAGAQRILTAHGGDASVLTVAKATNSSAVLGQALANGDGAVPAALVPAGAQRQLVADAVAATGGIVDRAGVAGLDSATLDAFLATCTAHTAWAAKGPGLCPPGIAGAAARDAAASAIAAIRPQVEDWFARCRTAAYDPRAADAANQADFGSLLAKPMDATAQVLVGLPLAPVVATGAALDLSGRINPAYAGVAAACRTAAAKPILGSDAIDAAGWATLTAFADAVAAYHASRPSAGVAALGDARVAAILADAASVVAVRALIAADLALAPEVAAIADAERLARYYRDLGPLLRNFVNFSDFYNPEKPASFQSGSLYLDQRRFDLVLRVADPGAHAKLAAMGRCYMLYCLCTRPGEKPVHIAAAATQGDADELRVGRNGVWFDRAGRDWDASVIAVIEAPISIREAFWMPYKKFGRMIEEQVLSRLSSANDAADAKMASAATATANADKGEAKPPAKFDVGTIAIVSVAIGAIGGAMAAFFGALAGLGWFLPLGLLGIMLAISGPSMLIAAIKLRRRSLGPLLEANGWAIGGRVKINLLLGGVLTARKQLPPGSTLSLVDPFASKSRAGWWWALFFLVVLAGAGWWYWKHHLPSQQAAEAQAAAVEGPGKV